MKYIDITLEDKPRIIPFETTVNQLSFVQKKNLGSCEDEYFHLINDEIRDAIPCYQADYKNLYWWLTAAFDLHLPDETPINQPRLETGDKLYLFQIAPDADSKPDCFKTMLTLVEVVGNDS